MGNEQTNAAAELSPEERDLRELALEEQFLAERRAGKAPQLAGYLRAYPEHAAALTDFVAQLLSEGEPAEAGSRPAPLTAGTQRALHALFAEPDGTLAQRSAVAESRASYLSESVADASGAESEASGGNAEHAEHKEDE
jgi:hypothetical protein